MSGKKHPIPPRQEVDRLLRQLEQAPGRPELARPDPAGFSPWNISMKKSAGKRSIACSLTRDDQE